MSRTLKEAECAAPACDHYDIHSAFVTNANYLRILEDTLGELTNRLAPVLRDDMPGNDNASRDIPCASPLVKEIESRNEWIMKMTFHLQNLINRLDT